MAYERYTPMRDTPMGWPMAQKIHAYEMAPLRSTPMRDAPVRDAPMRWPAYERHVYEMAPVRNTSMRDAPMRWPPMRDTPMRWSMGDVYLGDAFNQSIQIAFTIWDPKWPRSLSRVYFTFFAACEHTAWGESGAGV